MQEKKFYFEIMSVLQTLYFKADCKVTVKIFKKFSK